LLAGGTSLVRGASGLAESYGVPPLVVGLTVIAFGTSAPELVVNILGSLRGESGIAFGNITGSNIANIGLVLGLAGVITPIAIESQIVRRELPLLLLASTALLVMVLDPLLRSAPAILDRSDGIIMLLLFSIFVYITIMDFIRQRDDPLVTSVDALAITPDNVRRTNWLLVGVGVGGLSLGGQLTIDHGVALAQLLGVPSVIVGMFVVAIGTSLPELVTSIFAAIRGEADLCVGNVIGSNLFNSMFVLPISALIRPVAVPDNGAYDIFVAMILAALLVPVFVFGKTILSRKVSVCFLLGYAGYMLFRILVG